ncbi:MAG: hypothetical protein ACOZIN_00660 [Myxococcota bacterium]
MKTTLELRARLLARGEKKRREKLELPIVRGTSAPAVDIADRDALYDPMERR